MAAWQRKSTFGQRPTLAEARQKLERYCAYQDRCHQEVKRKLYDLGLYGSEVDHLMAELIESRFLDEERFARSYARGKFRMKAWGRLRIERELKQRQISPYCIRVALSEIDEQTYQATLTKLLLKELGRKGPGKSEFERRGMLLAYAQRKGYESELALQVINRMPTP